MFRTKTNSSKYSASIDDDEILLLATKVVDRYASKGSIPQREKEDVVMSMVEKFIIKQKYIQDNFQGKAKFSTYCISVLNNMCCEIIRRDMKSWNIQEKEDYQIEESSNINSLDKLAISDEINYLHKIILLFGDETPKIRLFLAYYLCLNILESDFKNYDKDYIKHNIKEILSINNKCSKGEIFKNLSEVVNIVENKDTKADAVRMWLNKTRNTIIERLNINSDNTHYDAETLHILFEYYYTIF